MEKINDFCVVFITTDTFESSQHISRIIVTEKLAACCTIIPNAISIYGWNGAVKESHEYMIIVKTQKSKLANLEIRVSEMHTYDVPEIISLNIESGNLPYLNWMNDCLSE